MSILRLLTVFMTLETSCFMKKTPSAEKHKGKTKIQWRHCTVMATPMTMKHRSEQIFIFI